MKVGYPLGIRIRNELKIPDALNPVLDDASDELHIRLIWSGDSWYLQK